MDFWFISRETSLLIGVLRDTVFIIGGVLLHDASELLVEGFRSLVAAGYGVFRAAVFLHDFDVGQPKGGRIFHHDVALFIERKLPLRGIVGAWLDLGIRVRIGEIKRADFTVLAVIKPSSFSSTKNLTCIGRLRFLLSGIDAIPLLFSYLSSVVKCFIIFVGFFNSVLKNSG